MPSPNATFTELVTSTMRNRKKEVVDNVSKHNALLTLMKEKGKIRTESGGTEIVLPLEYAENGTYQRFSGYDPLNTSPSDVISAAKFDWCQAALHVTASGREIRINSGKEAMFKLVKARVTNAVHTAANNMSIDIYSDGALSNQINGLGALITNAGTGTVGGINSSTYAFWQNKVTEAPGTNAVSTTNIGGYMNTHWLKQVRGKDKPDLLVSTHDFYALYEGSLQPNQRYMDAKMAGLGFESLKYKSAPIIFDDNTNFSTTGETILFLNTDYLYLIEHSDARWDQEEDRVPVNQDAVVIPMYWMGQMCVTNRALQGKLIDAA